MSVLTNIFIFAHQDDETGVFWELQRLVSCGENVIVVYLTSGDLSGKPSPIRDRESISVLEKIGIARDNIYFLGSEVGIPDGKLCNYLEIAFQSVLELLKRIGTPQRMYFLAWEGGHQDHDAVHLIGMALGKKFGILEHCFQFPLYMGHRLPSILFKLFSPLPENGIISLATIPWRDRFRFISYCLSYPSQKKTWIGLFPFFFLHYIFWGTQILQPVSLPRIRQQPHTGCLLYERRGFYSYKKFLRDSEYFLSRYLKLD